MESSLSPWGRTATDAPRLSITDGEPGVRGVMAGTAFALWQGLALLAVFSSRSTTENQDRTMLPGFLSGSWGCLVWP
jgi:hypothetical protein